MRVRSSSRLILGTLLLAFFLVVTAAAGWAGPLPICFQNEAEYPLYIPEYDPLGDPTFRGGNIQMGPDGKLWTFRQPSWDIGMVQTMDPVDGIFFNGNDIRSDPFGHNEINNASVFTPDWHLLQGDYYETTLRDPVDGVFFNGDDTIKTLPWKLPSANATRQPYPAHFDHNGKLYSLSYVVRDDGLQYTEIAVIDPVDGDLMSDSYTIESYPLPDDFPKREVWSIGFDNYGNLYTMDFHHYMLAIDPVDGVFFNGNDVHRSYFMLDCGLPDVFSPKGQVSIMSLTFDKNNHMILSDGDRQMLVRLSLIYDEDTDLPPAPNITANSMGHAVAVTKGEPVTLRVGSYPGDWKTKDVDWWVLAKLPDGSPVKWYSYSFATETWSPGIAPAMQGRCRYTNPLQVLKTKGLPAGKTTFYFGFDSVMNGRVNKANAVYDTVEVTVTP